MHSTPSSFRLQTTCCWAALHCSAVAPGVDALFRRDPPARVSPDDRLCCCYSRGFRPGMERERECRRDVARGVITIIPLIQHTKKADGRTDGCTGCAFTPTPRHIRLLLLTTITTINLGTTTPPHNETPQLKTFFLILIILLFFKLRTSY